MKRFASESGFGLLEAIVALAIFAAAGMALFAWLNGNLDRAARLAARAQETRALALANAYAEALDPIRAPEGRWQAGPETVVSWHARPIESRRRAAPLPGGTYSPFELARFEVVVEVNEPALAKPVRVARMRLGVWREPFALPTE